MNGTTIRVSGVASAVAAAILVALPVASSQAQSPLQRMDRDGDGRVSRSEFLGPPEAFRRLDADGDGFLTAQELSRARPAARGEQDSGRRDIPMTPAETPRISIAGVDTHIHLHPIGLAKTMRGERPSAPFDQAARLDQAADNLVARMNAIGIGTALVVTVPQGGKGGAHNETTETTMARAVARHPDRLALMGGGAVLNPMIQSTRSSAVSDAALAAFRARAEKVLAAGAKGFGEMISLHLCMSPNHNFQYAPADHPMFMALAAIAARHNVPIDLHMEAVPAPTATPAGLRRVCNANPTTLPAAVPALEHLLAANPAARIVWQHIGWDNVGTMTSALLQGLLDRHSNLFMALRIEARTGRIGGDGEMPNRLVDGDLKLLPAWRDFIIHNADRLVIGADDFIAPEKGNPVPSQSLNETWSIVGQLPQDVAVRVGSANARRIYGLR